MKKIILSLAIALTLFSCNVAQDQNETVDVSFGVSLPGNTSRSLPAITTPTVNYTILEGTATYLSASNIPLTNNAGVFTLQAALRKGSNYKFSEFTVMDGTTTVYTLDSGNTANVNGFSVNTTGAVTPNPAQVYLNYQLPDEYTDQPTNGTSLTLVEDFFTAENLTFKVKIPAGMTVYLYQLEPNGSIFRSKTLTDGDIYDMDSCTISNGEGGSYYNADNDVTTYSYYVTTSGGYWRSESGGADRYYFSIVDGDKRYQIYFSSADYNMKEVIFTNLGS